MSEMIDISKLKTWAKPHKVYIPSKYGVFVKRADLEQLLETAHNSDYAKSGNCESCVHLKDCDIESKASCKDFA